MVLFAITPHGVNNPVGARAVRPSWPLTPGETFTVADYQDGDCLAADGASLEPAQPVQPLTASQIYDDELTVARVLKAVVLALNDGTLVPGSNAAPSAIKAAIIAKM